MSDEEKRRARTRFMLGEWNGGKGPTSFFLAGDPDYESGVKTNLLREQNRLLEESALELKNYQREVRQQQTSEDAAQWLQGFAEYEKNYLPLTDRSEVHYMDTLDLKSRYVELTDAKNSVNAARRDINYSYRGPHSGVGEITSLAHIYIGSELESRQVRSYVEKLETGTSEHVFVDHSPLDALRAVNHACIRYLASISGPPSIFYSTKEDRVTQIKELVDGTIEDLEEGKPKGADIDSSTISLAGDLKKAPSRKQKKAFIDQRISEWDSAFRDLTGESINSLIDEFNKAPGLMADFNVELKTFEDQRRLEWLIITGGTILGILVVSMPASFYPLTWGCFLFYRHMVKRKACLPSLSVLATHLATVAKYGQSAATSYRSIVQSQALAESARIEDVSAPSIGLPD